ncbi:MAG: hypothetical protein K6D97_06950 [Clostridia bacterium]|nr:hypothetical protein [Clostridia bacterium]
MKIFENGKEKDVLFSIKVSTIVIAAIVLIVSTILFANIKNSIAKSSTNGEDVASINTPETTREFFNRDIEVTARGMEDSRTQTEASANTEVMQISEEPQSTNEPVEQVTTAGEPLEKDITVVSIEEEKPAEEENQEEQVEQEEVPNEEIQNYVSIDQVTISVDMDLTQRTGLSRDDFITLMAGVKADTSGFFEENAGLIYDMCEKYQLNEIFFCGLISAESGWNIAANHRRTHNYISLMSRSGLIQFASLEEGMEKAAKTLHDRYLTPGGSLYFGNTLNAVRTKFCPANPGWTNLVFGRMSQIIK